MGSSILHRLDWPSQSPGESANFGHCIADRARYQNLEDHSVPSYIGSHKWANQSEKQRWNGPRLECLMVTGDRHQDHQAGERSKQARSRLYPPLDGAPDFSFILFSSQHCTISGPPTSEPNRSRRYLTTSEVNYGKQRRNYIWDDRNCV